jgi:hypothetical protein
LDVTNTRFIDAPPPVPDPELPLVLVAPPAPVLVLVLVLVAPPAPVLVLDPVPLVAVALVPVVVEPPPLPQLAMPPARAIRPRAIETRDGCMITSRSHGRPGTAGEQAMGARGDGATRRRILEEAMKEEDLETPEMKRALRTLGAKPSRSAEAAREREIAAIRRMSVEERMLLALRLGRRDRSVRKAFEGRRKA